MQKKDKNQSTEGEAKAKPEVIKLGLDLHARQVTECRQLDGSTPKPAQQWDPWKLLDQIERWVKAGIKVYSCYEAGACGYWYHREVVGCGAINFVIAPQPLEREVYQLGYSFRHLPDVFCSLSLEPGNRQPSPASKNEG